jgi:hypothetical protein
MGSELLDPFLQDKHLHFRFLVNVLAGTNKTMKRRDRIKQLFRIALGIEYHITSSNEESYGSSWFGGRQGYQS